MIQALHYFSASRDTGRSEEKHQIKFTKLVGLAQKPIPNQNLKSGNCSYARTYVARNTALSIRITITIRTCPRVDKSVTSSEELKRRKQSGQM
jgi:hypothetical protein